MTRRDKRKLHLAIIVILAVGILGSSAWLVLYDSTSGRTAASTTAADQSSPPGPPPRDVESDIRRIRRTVQADGFIGGVLARYHLRAGRYPGRLGDLLKRPAELESGRWDGPYINHAEVLQDPWGRPYEYVSPGVHNSGSYDLWSVGLDGVTGTADDIGNW